MIELATTSSDTGCSAVSISDVANRRSYNVFARTTTRPSMKKKKLIVVTGATRGLGLAMSEGFIADGHQVIGCGRDTTSVRQLNDSYPHSSFGVIRLITAAPPSNVSMRAAVTASRPRLDDTLLHLAFPHLLGTKKKRGKL